MKVLISVVTYNRLDLLKKLIESLRNQSIKKRDILVVNNDSSDGTSQWLNEQNDLVIINQGNSGSSGGQHTAFKYAKDNNYDALWAMDDDVLPELNCLEQLLDDYSEDKIVLPLRYGIDGNIFFNETKIYNFTNPFSSLWEKIIDKDDVSQKLIRVDGPTFEGPLIPVSIIKKIGLPDKTFFIFGDDGEYFVRAKRNNYQSYLSTKTRLNRQLEAPKSEILFGWKEYYSFRNIIILDVLYGNLAVRMLRPIFYLMKFLLKSRSMDNIKTSFRAFIHGYFYRQKIDY